LCLFSRPAGLHAATVTITPAAVPTASDNDFTRIQNALKAAQAGDTIVLSGTFNFTEPNAAASWALGSDGVASTLDDYEVLVPPDLNNLTITATSLGGATIQGPGDLAAVNLEAFLVFDRSTFAGTNRNCTISNLQVFDFDLSIAMFGGADHDFDNTHIQNNLIRIATDLNATVAPVDVNQNIGIYTSYGTNQSILNNTIQIPGNGVSDSANGHFASTVGMQSDSAPGPSYDGLLISGNVIHVLHAQSADPESIIGIWENGEASSSNITVFNNHFINDDPGNDPTLNLQRAFRVTSHSSLTTTVTYDSNQVDGANTGFQWVAGADFTGLQPVVLSNNQITNTANGVRVQSNGLANLNRDTITGLGSGTGTGVLVLTGTLAAVVGDTRSVVATKISGFNDGILLGASASAPASIVYNDLSGNAHSVRNNTSFTLDMAPNWWGSNLQAAVLASAIGSVASDPWLASGTDQEPATPGFQAFFWASSSGASSHTTFISPNSASTGSLLAGDPVTMTMNGGTAFVPLAQLTGIDVALGTNDDVFTLGPVAVPVAVDGGAGNNTLAGTNVAQTWTITGPNTGSLSGGSLTFTNVGTLRGGTAADAFVLGAAGSLTGAVDGNLGADTLDNTAIAGHTISLSAAGSLDGFAGTATGVGSFDNIDTLTGVSADLGITVTAAASVNAGSNIVYTVTVTNNGPSDAGGVAVSDVTPAGLTFVSNTGACATPYPCSLGVIASGASRVITTTMTVPLSFAGASTSNAATVSSATTDPFGGNNNASANTSVVHTVDLAMAMTGPASATAGGSNLVYTVTVTNNGPSDATGVSIADVTPAGLTFVSNTGACTTVYPCALGTIASGSSAVITTTMAIPASFSGTSVSNTATGTTTATDTNNANDSANVTTTIAHSADVAIAMTGPANGTAGGANLVYTVTVTNNGPSDATGVSVADVTPAGLTFVSNAGACTTAYPCALGTIVPGGSAVITTTMAIPSSFSAASASNTATVSTTAIDSNNTNDSAMATTAIAQSADLALTMSGPPTGTPGGSNLVYTVTVTNNGPSDATGVSVASVTPAGLTFVSNAGACATAYPCALGTIAPGGSKVITTTLAIPVAFVGTSASNVATVTAATTDPSSLNNSATVTTTIAQGADLAITMTGPATGTAGGPNLVYLVTVTNNGPTTATGVSVADPTPAGLTFVSNTGACATAYPCALGTMAPGTSKAITTTMAVPSGFVGSSAVNTATVTATTTDPISSNNSASVTTTFGCQVTITGATLPLAIFGSGYSHAFGLTGGVAPLTFTIAGTLPAGLSLAGSVLSGTPTQRGAFPVTLQASDSRGCTASQPLTVAVSRGRLVTVGEGAGGAPLVRQFVSPNPSPVAGPLGEFDAFAPAFHGGVAVAQGDTNGDGIADVIAGAGPGGAPVISVFNGADGSLRLSFMAYPASLTTGVEVAAGDVNGDGIADIITAPGYGGPPLVRVFDGATGTLLREWLAMPASWIGGLHVGAGDVNGDGYADIIVGAGPGGGPLVQVFDGATGAMTWQFFAYAPAFPGGVYVAAGDVNGDGYADIITGAGPGGGPHVRVFDPVTAAQIPGAIGSFFAYDPAFPGGVRVAAGDINGDGIAEVITGAGPGGGPHVRVFDGVSGSEVFGFFAFDPGITDGTFVAGPPTLRRISVDVPQVNAAVTTTVQVAGWAFDESTVAAPGVDAVHVWALPVGGGAPVFVGATTTFIARPDVASLLGGEFLMSGFDLSGPLPAGTYDLVVFVHNSVTHVFDNRRVIRVTVH
jgi:uncharacterized repeat protein (TIGR01451 family)